MRRSVEETAESIVQECGWGKFTGSLCLTEYDPLVVIMDRVAGIIVERGGSFDKAKARKVWMRAVDEIQDNNTLEHNPTFPCRFCDQAFEPVIDDALLTAFLSWRKAHSTENLLAIHRCPTCGGQLKAKRVKPYKGDFHTPAPRTIECDDEWVDVLLENSSF